MTRGVVSIIGLDGLSFSYLNKMVSSGYAPYLSTLAEKAWSVKLISYPPMTFPSWTSILTGVNPGKHGIVGFEYVDTSTWEQKLLNAKYLGHPRLHEMLHIAGLESLVLNPIPPHPLLPTSRAAVIIHPFHATRVHSNSNDLSSKLQAILDDKVRYVDNYYQAIAEAYLEFLEDTIERGRWSLVWVVMMLPDIMLHDNPSLLSPKASKIEKPVFEAIDKMVKLFDGFSDHLFLVSDHGFSRYRVKISINDVLLEKGYARATALSGHDASREHGEISPAHSWRFQLKAPLKLLRIVTSHSIIASLAKRVYSFLARKKLVKALTPCVSIKHSTAFMPSHSSFGVYVKEPELVDVIINELRALNGIKWVRRREEVFWGPYVNRAPHIMLCPDFDSGYTLGSSRIYGKSYVFLEHCDHHPEGVLLIRSDTLDVKPQHVRTPNYIVAPLAMHLLGLELPASTDAKTVLEELLDEPPKYTTAYLSRWNLATRARALKVTA